MAVVEQPRGVGCGLHRVYISSCTVTGLKSDCVQHSSFSSIPSACGSPSVPSAGPFSNMPAGSVLLIPAGDVSTPGSLTGSAVVSLSYLLSNPDSGPTLLWDLDICLGG